MAGKAMVQITRKFSLEPVGKRFENFEVTVKAHSLPECFAQLEEAYKSYTEGIVAGVLH
jgi:hypothetical protein